MREGLTVFDTLGVSVFVSKDRRCIRIVAADAPDEPREDEDRIIRLRRGMTLNIADPEDMRA